MSSAQPFLARLALANSRNPRAILPLLRYYRPAIAAARASGASFKQIWAALSTEGKIHVRYETFRRHAPAVLAAALIAAPTQTQPEL